MSTVEAAPIDWVEAEKGYSLALENNKLVCQNAKGKQLASVPKWLKDSDQAQQLIAVAEWLEEHERECQEHVEQSMLRSLPLPHSVLASIWPDPTWQQLLVNLVACSCDKKGQPDLSTAGFIRGVDPKKGVGVVDLDGETGWLKSETILIPHPILLEELDDFRSLATELDFQQKVDQLFRETWSEAKTKEDDTSINDFSGGDFEQLNHVMGLCRRLGYRVRGGYAVCAVWESGKDMVEARFWIGADYPEGETSTGELMFCDRREKSIALKDVGPVAFSEGMRMASAIYAKRVIEKKEDDD